MNEDVKEKETENKEQDVSEETKNEAEEVKEEHQEQEEEKTEEKSEEKSEEKPEESKEEEPKSEEEKPAEEPKPSEEKKNKKDRFKAIKIVWKVLKTILVIVMLLVFFVIAVQRLSNNKITVAGYGVYTIVSESMVPEYNIWDMLVAKKIDPSEIRVGDDVVYQGKEGDFEGKIVTHRVIKANYDGERYRFITKGIANPIEDPEIFGDQIYGKVVLKSTALSTISKVLNNSYGFYFIVFVPLVIIVTLEVIDTVNERKKLKEE